MEHSTIHIRFFEGPRLRYRFLCIPHYRCTLLLACFYICERITPPLFGRFNLSWLSVGIFKYHDSPFKVLARLVAMSCSLESSGKPFKIMDISSFMCDKGTFCFLSFEGS